MSEALRKIVVAALVVAVPVREDPVEGVKAVMVAHLPWVAWAVDPECNVTNRSYMTLNGSKTQAFEPFFCIPLPKIRGMFTWECVFIPCYPTKLVLRRVNHLKNPFTPPLFL